MSTRCQVQVVEGDGKQPWEKLTLYHHSDGYPTHILPEIVETFEEFGKGWEGYRAGKVASFLCAAHPGTFEPEAGHTLHGDIEWYYVLQVGEKRGGEYSMWNVDVYKVRSGRKKLVYHGSIEDARDNDKLIEERV